MPPILALPLKTGIGIPTGRVGSYAEKMAAEAAMWLVSGVWAIAEEIEVIHPERGKHADDQMAPRARRTGH